MRIISRISYILIWNKYLRNKMKNYLIRNLRGSLLTSYKETLTSLNDIQRDVLIGTLLGDASMQAMKGDQESNVKFEQKIAQMDYVNHLYEIFQDFVGTPPQVRNITGGGAKDRQSVWFRTYRHPLFAFYKELFYKVDENGKQIKIVPPDIRNYLTPRALAYWYMDDGSVMRRENKYVTENNKEYVTYVLNAQGFTYSDQLILVEALKEKLNLTTSLWKDKDSHKIAILTVSRDTFRELISPYIVPSFRYKL